MNKFFVFLGVLICFFLNSSAQVTQNSRQDSSITDTAKTQPYVNKGKIAAKRAAIQSAILPGLGQLTNKVSVWSIGKVGLIYGGTAALAISYADNTKKYNLFLDELKYRQQNNNVPNPNSPYASYPTPSLITAKDVYRRNREIIIFSYVGVYAINIIDAYVSARLKYFDVGDNLSVKISPSVVNQDYFFAQQFTPALKLTLKL